jgi:heme/copper-type cytochrome/quinol oxidase subunit 3
MAGMLATRKQRATALYLCADFIIFLALFTAYIYLRRQSAEWPSAFHFASGLMAVSITLFVLSASVAMFFAAQHQAKESFEIAMRLAVACIAVWGSALILVGMEWLRLILIAEVTLTTNPWGVPAFGETYFVLTGYLALHLLAGMIYLGVTGARIRTSDAGACALFVHFTSLVWLILFVGIYLAGTDLQGI